MTSVRPTSTSSDGSTPTTAAALSHHTARTIHESTAPTADSSGMAPEALSMNRPASVVASARHAINARTRNNAANGTSGEAVAGSMRTITGNTNSRTGAAYDARVPSRDPHSAGRGGVADRKNGRRTLSAMSGASA